MRSVIIRSASGRRHRGRRAVAVGVLSAAVVAVMVDPGPAQAATIPTPPSACKTTFSPGDPVMTSFAVNRSSVNVKSGPKKFTFTIHATDSTKAIKSISVSLTSPTIHGVQRFAGASLKLAKHGDPKNGTWSGSATIPQWTNNGTWAISSVFLFDAGGGSTYYSPTGGSKPWNNAWKKTVSVISTPDTTPPVIKSAVAKPTLVDTSSKAQPVKLTIKASDTQSGVRGVFAGASVKIGSKSYFAFPKTGWKRTAGTPKNGTWTASVSVPRWVQKGTHAWTVQVSASDALNGSNKTFANKFKVKSKTDATKPALKGLTYTPHSVDARSKNKPVAFTVKATDTLSGIAYAIVTIRSHSGFSSSGYLSRHSGTPLKGTFTGKVVVPRCSEPGTWTVSVQIVDVAGNVSSYTPAQLKAKHFGSTLSVKAIDTVPPTAKVPAKVPAAGPVTLTFSEATLWKNSANSTVDVYDYSKSGSPISGTWACKNAAGSTVTCDANGANVKTAAFTPSSAFGHGDSVYIQQHASYPAPVGIYDTTGNALSGLFLSTTVT